MPYCPNVGTTTSRRAATTTTTTTSAFPGSRGATTTADISDPKDNNVGLFSAGGMDFVVISLEYDTTPDQPVLDWATACQGQSEPARDRGQHYIVGTGNPAAFGTQGQAITTT